MVVTRAGIAVLDVEHDRVLSRWVERDDSLDAYDPRIRKVFAPMIPAGGWVVDGGAFLGSHTVAYAEAVGRKGCVMAFEPVPSHADCLRFNTRRYPQVEVVQMALYEEERELWMVPSCLNAGASVVGSLDDDHAFSVQATCIDHFDFPRLDFIKLDIEGLVLRALEGAYDTLRTHGPVVVVEMADNLELFGDTADGVVSFMEELGYIGRDSIYEGDHDMIFTVKE